MTQTGDSFSRLRCNSTLLAVNAMLDVVGH